MYLNSLKKKKLKEGNWTSVKTSLPMPEMQPAHAMKNLKMTVGYNKSDATFGWNGFNNGLTLYFLAPDEEFVTKEHGYPLVEGLSPSVSFSLIQTKYLGKPYTECNSNVNYTHIECTTHNLMKEIIEKCECYPR